MRNTYVEHRAREKAMRIRHREYQRTYYIAWHLRQFGISVDEYQSMYEAQNGKCAICRRPENATDYRTKKVKALSVDHDHETGKVRGLLCNRCNRCIGVLGEDVVIAAARYLEVV